MKIKNRIWGIILDIMAHFHYYYHRPTKRWIKIVVEEFE